MLFFPASGREPKIPSKCGRKMLGRRIAQGEGRFGYAAAVFLQKEKSGGHFCIVLFLAKGLSILSAQKALCLAGAEPQL